MNTTRIRRIAALGAVGALAAAGLAACGSNSGSSAAGASGGIAKTITVEGVRDLSGDVAYAGVGAKNGDALAVDQINSQGYLGKGVTIKVVDKDAAGDMSQANSLVSKAIADKSVSALLGPVSGQEAAAVAPLVQRGKLPTVFTQAGSAGVVIGDETFRATAPMDSYFSVAMKWLQAHGAKKIDVIYNATYPTFVDVFKNAVEPEAKKAGMTIGNAIQVQATSVDFASQAAKIASSKPDAVIQLMTATQSVTFIQQLRQAGFTGQIVGSSADSAGNIAAAGASANGTVYPVDFSPVMTDKTAQDFVAAYKAKFGKAPDLYAAEGYTAMWWIARAIKESGSSSREGIQKGLAAIAKSGFGSPMGTLTFDGNDMRVPGQMIEWNNGKEQLAK